jgi:hypothetical protein
MAQDIGLLLRGLGAAVSNQVPQFRQQMAQEQEAQMRQQEFQAQQEQRMRQGEMQNMEMMQARQQATFQDADAALRLAAAGNYEAIIALGEDRMRLDERLGGPLKGDTTPMLVNMARRAAVGDTQAANQLNLQLLGTVEQGRSRGVLKMPEVVAPKPLSASNIQMTTEGPMVPMQQADGTITMAPAPFTPAAQPEPSVRERESRIQEYMSNFGMSRPEAISRLDAQYMTDPVTGNLIAVNRTIGEATIPRVATGEAPASIPAPPNVTPEQLAFDPGKGTGLGASFLGLWNSTIGQAPFVTTFMGAETAAQQLAIIERDAIRALASSSRPPLVEQERILQALPKAMDWSENPDVARSKLTSFIDLMTTQYVDDLRYSKDLSMPKALREASSERARGVESLIGRVLTPEAGKAMFDSIRSVEQSIEQVRRATPEQLQTIDPSTLDDAALDEYIERLKRGG